MADISITLEVDDSKYQDGLKKADKATQLFGENGNKIVKDLENSFKNLSSSFQPLEIGFNGLMTALVGLFSAKKLVDYAEWANNIVQTGKAVNFTTGEMIGLQAAVMQAGGTALAASRGIEMFYMKLDQARQGGLAQQVAFERIGISLKDLRELDDRTLFEKTIEQLSKMPANAERNRIEVELLSRSFRGIPLQEIQARLEETRGEFDQFGPVLDDAGAAYRRLQQDITNFKIAALTVMQPILQAFTDGKPTVDNFVTAIRGILIAFTAILAVNFAIKMMALVDVFFALVPAIRAAVIALDAFVVAEGIASLGIATLVQLAVKLGIIGVTAYGVISGVEALDKALEENKGKNQAAAVAATEKVNADRKLASEGQNVYTQYDKLNALIGEQTKLFKKNIEAQIESIKTKGQDAGMGTELKARLEEELKIRQEFERKLGDLNARLKEAQAARPETEQYYTQGTLKKAIADLTAEQERYTKAAGDAAAQTARNINLSQMQLQLAEDRAKIDKTIADIQLNIDQLTMTNDEKKLSNIEKQTNEYIKLAIEKRRAQLGINVSDEELKQDKVLQDVIQGIRDKQKETVSATQAEIAASRDWSTGWNAAFKQYKDDATNAAAEAKRIFDIATKGMEDAFVTFAKTGKLSFKDLLSTMVEELLRSQIRQLMGSLLTMSGGGGGLFSGIGKLLGFADGGTIPTNGPVLVGERGPELLIGGGGMNVIPNSQLGGGGSATSYVTYNINAVDAPSFKAMIARDPGFIHAVAMQGALSVPGRR